MRKGQLKEIQYTLDRVGYSGYERVLLKEVHYLHALAIECTGHMRRMLETGQLSLLEEGKVRELLDRIDREIIRS